MKVSGDNVVDHSLVIVQHRFTFIVFNCNGTLHVQHSSVTVPTVTLARKVGPGLQDLQRRARRKLAERNAEKAEENTWIGRMVAAESIEGLNGLIKSRAAYR